MLDAMASSPLIPEQRQREVLRLLRASGALGIRALADHLAVSHMTIRRDIGALEEQGLVASVPGGVRLTEASHGGPPRERAARAGLELPRKHAIAAAAAALVEDGQVVFLDAGTTCEAVVPLLATRRDLTVVTNDLYSATVLLGYPAISSVHTGGTVDTASGSTTGPLAAATLSQLSLDIAFLSTGTWDIPHGVTTPELDQVTLKRAALSASSTSVLVADSTKFGASERFRVAGLDAFDIVVTDAGLPKESVAAVLATGTDVRLA